MSVFINDVVAFGSVLGNRLKSKGSKKRCEVRGTSMRITLFP